MVATALPFAVNIIVIHFYIQLRASFTLRVHREFSNLQATVRYHQILISDITYRTKYNIYRLPQIVQAMQSLFKALLI